MKLGCGFLLLFCGSAFAIGPDPAHDWRSFDTGHFVVHYEANNRAQAETAAAIAETAWTKITPLLNWRPQARTELVLLDDYDLANGFASPLPFNHTGIFLTAPDDGELLENSDWLELVITHELSHIVHLDKVRGAPGFLQHIFGRHPLLLPGLWQPSWLIEGLATYVESDPETHRGRLDNTIFDAYMRLEVQQGLESLREINSDGRAFPLNKAYLYGAYFYRFLEQQYGQSAVYRLVNDYSDNLIPFRVHSNPVTVTGKPMDELWLVYQNWLRARFISQPEPEHAPLLLDTRWDLASPVLASDGNVYVVIDDGLVQPYVLRVLPDGRQEKLVEVEAGARIDLNRRGELLIAQPEICDNYHYYYDLYRWSAQDGSERLSTCGRYRYATWQGDDHIIAIHNDPGHGEIQQLDRSGRVEKQLYLAQAGEEISALAVQPDGARIAWTSKRNGNWQLTEMELMSGTRKVIWSAAMPLLSPRYSADGQFILVVHDVAGRRNGWRIARDGSRAERLTDVNTAVAAITGSDANQHFATLELATGGVQLRRYATSAVLATRYPEPLVATERLAPAPAVIRNERDYSALETLAPRAWFPTAFIGEGALAFGAEVFGQDALGWHQYSFSPQYETSEGQWLGMALYGYNQRHFLALYREMAVTASSENDDDEVQIDTYELRTTAQWLSWFPWLRLDRQIRAGFGAASARETYHVVDGPKVELQDEKIAALFVSYDSRRGSWWSEGSNRGQLFSLLAESYDPFAGRYEGEVYRADWRGQYALGTTTLALRYTEARGEDGSEPFELGGSYNSENFGIPRLNERDLALRGYDNGGPALTGKHARIGGIEWRTPLADIDRHFMVPPIGLNRVSAALFYELGAAWSGTSSPPQYYRSAGVELLAELKLGYRLGLLLRAGFARGLDEPGGDEIYLQLGRSF